MLKKLLGNTYDVEFCSVLDLFAGIGSISLEFASRDCKDITAVEMNPKHAAFINSTAAELEMSLQINIQRADVFDYLKKQRNKKSYEIVFADPPFDLEEKKYQELISLVLNNHFLKENGTFVLEHQSKTKIEHPNLKETRKYGNVSFSIFRHNTEK